MVEAQLTNACPWPGPVPYLDQQYMNFAGRTHEASELAAQVRSQWLAAMLAGSGVGKTSLLQAGVLPLMRNDRLTKAIAQAATTGEFATNSPVAPFPLVVNKWLRLRSVAAPEQYIGALIDACWLSITDSLDWYRFQLAETLKRDVDTDSVALARALEAEIKAVERVIEARVPVEDAVPDSATQEALVNDLLGLLVDNFGSVILVLDQFEEVLLNPVCKDRAIHFVDFVLDVWHPEVRQLISMREDFTHLLDSLGLEERRIYRLKPMRRQAMCDAVATVATGAMVTLWDPKDLVDAIAGPGDVDLLVLQAVLRQLFINVTPDAAGVRTIERSHLDNLSDELESAGLVVENRPFAGMLRRWIDRCLEWPWGKHLISRISGDLSSEWAAVLDSNTAKWVKDTAGDAVWYGQAETTMELEHLNPFQVFQALRRMTARMADSLVSHSNVKRPVEEFELRLAAYGSEIGLRDEAGVGSRDAIHLAHARKSEAALKELQGSGQWRDCEVRTEDACDPDRLEMERRLDALFEEALERLARGGILKRSHDTLELVHDGFARPLRGWAKSLRGNPIYVLGSPYMTVAEVMDWDGSPVLEQDIPLGDWFNGQRWKAFKVHNADFSGVVFKNCHFTDGAFFGCEFTGARFVDCVLTNCLVSGGSMVDVRFEKGVDATGCDLKRTAFMGTHLAQVVFENASLERSFFGNQPNKPATTFDGVSFEHCSGPGLGFGPGLELSGLLWLKECTVPGMSLGPFEPVGESCLIVDRSALDGGAMSDIPQSGRPSAFSVAIVGSSLKGAQMSNLAIAGDGAGLEDLVAAAGHGVYIADSDLSGAIVTDCDMQRWAFVRTRAKDPSGRTTELSLNTLGVFGAKAIGALTVSSTADSVPCDGFLLGEAPLTGPIVLQNCRLVRSEFRKMSRIDGADADAMIDLTASTVLYSRFGAPDQVASASSSATDALIVVSDEAWEANRIAEQKKEEEKFGLR